MDRRPTIIDVAGKAGVSKSTVSLVLQNSPLVKADTARQVREAMADLGYVYNRAAANLRGAGAGLIGLVINDLRNPFFTEFATSVQMALSEQGYAAVVANTDEDLDLQSQVVGAMIEHGVSAIILSPAFGDGDGGFDAIARAGIPALQVLRKAGEQTNAFPFAAPDYHSGGRIAAEHLLVAGAKRIAFVGGVEGRSVTQERMAGYFDALAAAGIDPLVLPGRASRNFGRDIAKRLAERHPDVDAALCFNDLVALGLVSGCAEIGRKVGAGGLKIVGFDDIEECGQVWPTLSSVRCDISRFGKNTAKAILDWLREGVVPVSETRSPVELIVRQSSCMTSSREQPGRYSESDISMIGGIPQAILDSLTDVSMPRLNPEPGTMTSVEVEGHHIPVHTGGVTVVGSGAAGLRAAVELRRRDVDVTIISQSAWGGTSACSGSDKQTLHTANTADHGDDYTAMARAIRSGGAMDEDMSYIEAVGSGRAMASLQYLGLPLPQDPLGGTLRYQTDHDDVGRATSCGPRTSRLMVQVLSREAIRLGIPFFNQTTGVKILKGEDGGAAGILAIRPKNQSESNPYGFVLFQSPVLVLAAGGPGELYRDSVFPHGCFGFLGLALETGLELVNLTESQFGIGTRREGFPWNLSGTYVQAIPHIYSVDDEGREHHFLADYYRTTQELASNVFRKGYQWPFHATRMLDFGSSLVDLAIYRECESGRRVLMDFNRNPLPVPGDRPFSLDRLDEDVSAYLGTAGADHETPIQRLRHMNPLAIELYRRYKIDVAADPLEFAVNNQHMNGGIAVGIWGQSNLPGVYAVGEAAGTHGVTRPGGAALNAGQVFGTRVAEHAAANGRCRMTVSEPSSALLAAVAEIRALQNPESPLSVKGIRQEVQARMSDNAGILCTPGEVREALSQARALNKRIQKLGIAPSRESELPRVLQWQQIALASEAVLSALDYYIANGGGSRGARAICDPAGTCVPNSRSGPLDTYRFREEQEIHKSEQIAVCFDSGTFQTSLKSNRTFDEGIELFFERDWPAWLTGEIYSSEGNR